jgi:dienelactone hydrolase
MLLALLSACGAPARTASSVSRAASPRVRVLHFARGADRPLETTVWSPADGGRHPVVLFSHGLGGLPSQFAPIAATWVAAGFVVVAPAYPHTNGKTKVNSADVRRQPADAEFVLRSLRGDPSVDLGHVAAIGFSAGGTTTLGLLHPGHWPGLVAAVSIAGRRPSSAYGGKPVPVLFVHGDQDPTVPLAAGRAAYEALPWPKTFVTVPGGHHGDYLNPGNPEYPRISQTIRAFLLRTFTQSGAGGH